MISALLALIVSSSSSADGCSTAVSQAEKLVESDCKAAETLAQKAVALCAATGGKSARPFMVLATCANRAGRFKDVIAWSEKGLAAEPGLALADMDECAAYIGFEDYDRALSACKKGLAQPSAWSAKLNFNAGLAVFKKAVAASRFADALAAEPFFEASQRADPSLTQNDFYLGTIMENVRRNPGAAVPLFQAACEQHDAKACDSLARAKREAAAAGGGGSTAVPASGAGAGSAPGAADDDEAKLWAQLEENYRRKGLSAEAAGETVSTLKKNFAAVPTRQRVASLREIVRASAK